MHSRVKSFKSIFESLQEQESSINLILVTYLCDHVCLPVHFLESMPEVVLSEVQQELARQSSSSLVQIDVAFQCIPNVFLQNRKFVIHSIVNDLLAEQDCSTRIQIKLIFNYRHVYKFNTHDSHNFRFHLRDLSENDVFVSVLFSTDIVKDLLHEVVCDEVLCVLCRAIVDITASP